MSEELPAGRELDVQVAEKVMGWEWETESWFDEEAVEVRVLTDGERRFAPEWTDRCDGLPAYSTSIAAAWEVVEKLTKGVGIAMTRHPNGDSWEVSLYKRDEDGDYMAILLDDVVSAGTAPLAICRAALKAVEETGPAS